MVEIRIHGRGGQGGVTLAKIIATARFLEGDSVQAFGLYAAERSGAPIQAFCRYSDEPIQNRNLIYEPDHVVVLDPTLIGRAVSDGLKRGGWIVLNSPEEPASFRSKFPDFRLATVDATAIAKQHGLGTRSLPIVNTALSGAVGRAIGIELDQVIAAFGELGFKGGNEIAAAQAWDEVRMDQKLLSPPEETRAEAAAEAPPLPSFLEGGRDLLPGIRTGQWAVQQPKRQQQVAPCNHVCPAGNDVRAFLQALAAERLDEALAILLATSPLPGVCGRVCPAPCMENCNRIAFDGAVNVRDLERYAADHGQCELESAEPRSERIAVVGSGPAGLTAAYHLARFGYRVTLFEAADEIGGLLRTGIPGYRLPDDVVDREVGRILDLGVRTRTDARIDRPELLRLAGEHEAVLVATGLQELQSLRLGMAEADAVMQGLDFLERSSRGEMRVDGEIVIVVGGGNTALDAARSALRLGAEQVTIVYRRTRLEMPAIPEEIDQGIEEGVEIEFLTQPIAIRSNGAGPGEKHYHLSCRQMELGAADESGRRRPVEVEGSDFELACDRVILALGQSPDLAVFPEGTEVREERQLLGLLETPVYAIGDLATRDGTVAGAIGSGRRAALHIHETLSGELLGEPSGRDARRPVDVWSDHVVQPEALRMHLFERVPPAHGGHKMPWERISNFDEVHTGLVDPGEARRCLSCGGCNECDRCVTYCPEGVLKRVGHEFVFDYSFCKGCGVCAAECPRDVIFMSHL